MKTGDLRTISVNGRRIPAAFLGKGLFCTAYTRQDEGESKGRVVCLYKEENLSKGILADCYRYGPFTHLPEVERIDDANDATYIYQMPLYAPLTAENKEAWRQFKTLQKRREEVWQQFCQDYLNGKNQEVYNIGYLFNQLLEEFVDLEEALPDSLKTAISKLTDHAASYGSEYIFDGFCKANCKTDANGTLILLDPMLNCRELERRRDEQARKYRDY